MGNAISWKGLVSLTSIVRMKSLGPMHPLIIMSLLLLLVVTTDGNGHEQCPEGLCKGPSGKFKGPCASDGPCRETCQKEGFETGICPTGGFLFRRCNCCKPC